MDLLLNIMNNIQNRDLNELPELSVSSVYNEFVFDQYEKYKRFMKRNNLPNFKLKFKNTGLNINTSLAVVEYIDEMYYVYISDKALENEALLSILYHEFTHIFDREYLYDKYKFNKKENVKTHVFTEIHAEQMRIMYLLGCNSISDNLPMIDYNFKILNMDGNEIGFYSYLEQFKSEIIKYYVDDVKILQSRKGFTNNDLLEKMVNKIAYYIGALSIYVHCCSYKKDVLMDLSNLDNFWQVKVSDVINLYCDNNIMELKKYDIISVGYILMHEMLKSARENLRIVR